MFILSPSDWFVIIFHCSSFVYLSQKILKIICISALVFYVRLLSPLLLFSFSFIFHFSTNTFVFVVSEVVGLSHLVTFGVLVVLVFIF